MKKTTQILSQGIRPTALSNLLISIVPLMFQAVSCYAAVVRSIQQRCLDYMRLYPCIALFNYVSMNPSVGVYSDLIMSYFNKV